MIPWVGICRSEIHCDFIFVKFEVAAEHTNRNVYKGSGTMLVEVTLEAQITDVIHTYSEQITQEQNLGKPS